MQRVRRPLGLLCLALVPLLQSSRALRLGMLLPGEEAAAAGHHDLAALAGLLRERGHNVRIVSAAEQNSPDWEEAITQPGKLHPAFDAILAMGSAAVQGEGYLQAHVCCRAMSALHACKMA
jgi:hypothetical protein